MNDCLFIIKFFADPVTVSAFTTAAVMGGSRTKTIMRDKVKCFAAIKESNENAGIMTSEVINCRYKAVKCMVCAGHAFETKW